MAKKVQGYIKLQIQAGKANPSPPIVVIAVGDGRGNSRSVVPFGRVIRDGGETVELFVDQTQPLDALLGDWTATHEFSHMLLPYIDSRQRWMSEGFSQYYQNVLLTRSGAYDEQYAWQKLYDGLERVRNSRPELSPNEAMLTAFLRSHGYHVAQTDAGLELILHLFSKTGLDDIREDLIQRGGEGHPSVCGHL